MSQYRARVHDRFASLLVVLVLLTSSCSASTQIPLRDVTAPSVAAEGDSTADSTIGAALSSEEVYREIEKSIVYVEAPDGLSSGSGFVIDGGWIVTNAHVVDRHQSMQIGRSDGSGLGLVPVHAVDWVFDLALIGPIDDLSLLPIARGESASLSLGSRVLLAGFPDEDSATPTPTLTEGIVSRRRFVAIGDYPFVQVDATIAPGQSGGALINGRGELVGISGLEFGEGEFGLAFASDPMWPRVEDMIAVGGLALPSGPPSFELTGQVGPLRNFSFTLEVEESGSVDVLVTSVADVWVDLQTLGGITVGQAADSVDPFRSRSEGDTQWYIDDLVEGGEEILATAEFDHVVDIGVPPNRHPRVSPDLTKDSRSVAGGELGPRPFRFLDRFERRRHKLGPCGGGRAKIRQFREQFGTFPNRSGIGHPDIDPVFRQFPNDPRRIFLLVRDHQVRRDRHNRFDVRVLRSA